MVRTATNTTRELLARLLMACLGVKSYDNGMLGTNAYRKALANAPNTSVNIASIGMPTNLADLLLTNGDKCSPMNGYDLIQAKVKKNRASQTRRRSTTAHRSPQTRTSGSTSLERVRRTHRLTSQMLALRPTRSRIQLTATSTRPLGVFPPHLPHVLR
jgi:hypothetical protein